MILLFLLRLRLFGNLKPLLLVLYISLPLNFMMASVRLLIMVLLATG